MKLDESTVLITGAAGGIGSCTARNLAESGARLLLTDLRKEPLDALADEIESLGALVVTLPGDLGRAEHRRSLASLADELGVDTLINIAGINPFGLFVEQTDAQIEAAIAINTTAPILLCRALLPVLAKRNEAHIVNVGSVFGSLGYPGFAAYTASKFAIRGFTEALRRELADSSVRMHYVAPRATRTALSTERVLAMNEALGVGMDPAATVAAAISRTLRDSRQEVYLGRSERIFAWLNSIAPRLVDRALRRQLPIVKRFASHELDENRESDTPRTNIRLIGAQR